MAGKDAREEIQLAPITGTEAQWSVELGLGDYISRERGFRAIQAAV